MWRRREDNWRGTGGEPPEKRSDEALALRAASDPAAFAELYRRYAPEIFALCRRRTASRVDAEDVAADVFHKALKGIGTFTGGNVRAWLYRIALNTLYDRAGRPPAPGLLPETMTDPAPGPEELGVHAAGLAELRTALARLPEEMQLVIELRLAGRSCLEIARMFGKESNWVSVTHHRAVERLSRQLAGPNEGRGRRA